ncbi:MAG: ureidoglycolate lyase, partial [Rhodospirillaceae bacterium]|nr:ureidoglycolate lyase [Rhodospirillaceae bacterium]
MDTLELFPAPLTKEVFAPFGDVIETDGAQRLSINEGTTDRFHDLAGVDVSADGGKP